LFFAALGGGAIDFDDIPGGLLLFFIPGGGGVGIVQFKKYKKVVFYVI